MKCFLILTDMELDMVADKEVDKVADMAGWLHVFLVLVNSIEQKL